MNVFPAIEGSSCYRYNNALHMSFHDHMHQVFAGYLEDYLKKLNLTQAIVDEYGEDVEVEQDLNRKSSANTNPIKMDEEDAERDRLLSVMFYMVSNGLKASKAAVKAAAQQLDVVLRPYKGAQGAADDAETSLIKGLILDLRKEENTAAVTTLGLDATVDELEEAPQRVFSAGAEGARPLGKFLKLRHGQRPVLRLRQRAAQKQQAGFCRRQRKRRRGGAFLGFGGSSSTREPSSANFTGCMA